MKNAAGEFHTGTSGRPITFRPTGTGYSLSSDAAGAPQVNAVRTPLDHARALALGNKIYRKQIIKAGELHYQGGTFPITDAYLDEVVKAFDAKALTKVPFQLADAANTHTEDPLRRFGTITGLHRTPEGLDAVIELNDEAARLVDEDPDFGVSVLIKHDRTTGEGKHFPAVLTHVLGTLDPVLTSLQPWQPELAASNDTGPVLDLLALTSAPTHGTTEGTPMADATNLTPEETAQLRSLLPLLAKLNGDQAEPADEQVVETPAEHADEGDREYTDDELAAMVATFAGGDDEGADDEAPADEQELIAASNAPTDEVLALTHQLEQAQQHTRDQELRLAQLEAERNTARYVAERDTLAREFGVHPRITDIVRPLLEGSAGEIALANGGKANPGELIRRFVKELASSPRLDLSHPVGSPLDIDEDADGANERAELAKLAVSQLNS